MESQTTLSETDGFKRPKKMVHLFFQNAIDVHLGFHLSLLLCNDTKLQVFSVYFKTLCYLFWWSMTFAGVGIGYLV